MLLLYSVYHPLVVFLHSFWNCCHSHCTACTLPLSGWLSVHVFRIGLAISPVLSLLLLLHSIPWYYITLHYITLHVNTSWLAGFARVAYYAPTLCHMHPLHNWIPPSLPPTSHTPSLPPSLKLIQYICCLLLVPENGAAWSIINKTRQEQRKSSAQSSLICPDHVIGETNAFTSQC